MQQGTAVVFTLIQDCVKLSSREICSILFYVYSLIIQVDVNTAVWLIDPPGATLIIYDNLGWYCEVANIFIRQLQIQIVPWNNRN